MQNQTPHPMPEYHISAENDLEMGLIEEFKRVLSRVREYSTTKNNATLLRRNYAVTHIQNCVKEAFNDVLESSSVEHTQRKFYDFIAYCLMLSVLSNERTDFGFWQKNNEDILITLKSLVKAGSVERELGKLRELHQQLKEDSANEIHQLQQKLKRSEDARVDAHNKYEHVQDKLESMFNELARTAVSLGRAEIELITLRDKLARYERKEQDDAVNAFKQDNAARLLLAKKPTPADLYGTIKSEVQLNEDGVISGFGMASTTTEKLSITADSFDVRLVACENKLDALANRVNNVIERKE